MKRFWISAVIVAWSATAFCVESKADSAFGEKTIGFDTIAGDLPGVVVAKARPYLVVSDIYVAQGKTVIIEAGVVFLFKNFAGLHVSGAMLAKGAKDKPIVFTSENDKEYNRASTVDPAPFDWNGIYLHEDAIGTQLSFCAVLYSVDGVNSLTKFIRISPCLFLHNGRAGLTIEGKQQHVTDQPYEYALPTNDPALKAAAAALLRDPHAHSRAFIRFSGIAFGATGLIVGIVYASRLYGSSKEFDEKSSTVPGNLSGNSSASWSGARNEKKQDAASLLAGIGVLCAGGIGLGWSYTF